jgi:hypothetical protein
LVSAIRETPLLDRQENLHALFRRHLAPRLVVRCVGFLQALKDAHYVLHASHFSATDCYLYRPVPNKFGRIFLYVNRAGFTAVAPPESTSTIFADTGS